MAAHRKLDRRRDDLSGAGHRNYVSHPEPAKWGFAWLDRVVI
jgi:hypothetical protein